MKSIDTVLMSGIEIKLQIFKIFLISQLKLVVEWFKTWNTTQSYQQVQIPTVSGFFHVPKPNHDLHIISIYVGFISSSSLVRNPTKIVGP